MTNINWLHLTDLHRGMTMQETLWSNARTAFFSDLEALHTQVGSLDIIFFTGDLVNKGSESEFNKLNETLRRLYNHLNKLGSNPILLTVPGNHDLVRPNEKSPTIKMLMKWSKESDVQDDFWEDTESPYRNAIAEAFKNYTNWQRTHPFPKPDEQRMRSGILPGDFSATIAKDDVSLGVVGLNTTFLQLGKGNYQGKLALHTRQLVGVCGEEFNDWFESNTLSILMTHQPPNWLDNESKEDHLESEISLPGRFLSHMFGHMHEPSSYIESIGGDLPKRYWQGCSLFGLEEFAGSKRKQRLHGYSLGHISIEGTKGQLRLWPRQAVRSENKKWQFIPQPSANLEADGGTRSESINLNSPKLLPLAVPFRVLVLSTEIDLADTRQSVASYIRNALGAVVVEGPVPETPDAAGFDWIVLLQGRRWEDGRAVNVWYSAVDSQRSAFIVDEDSEWPPFKLSELSAMERIEDFRGQLENPYLFDLPSELPNIVGTVITKVMNELRGDNGLGLREWERTYLMARLPAWIAGRTAGSKAYLLDTENAQELYQADLYVPLEGSSTNWYCDKSGRPKAISKKVNEQDIDRDVLLFDEVQQRRVTLSKWLSVPKLPRLTIVGAPGGGKTVFLTRIAAALAHACLGHATILESDLDTRALRRNSGTLPLPVVLEATLVARFVKNGSNGVKALVEAIAEEIEKSSLEKPKFEDVESGLKNGRYLLLIDALDEIAEPAHRATVLNILKGLVAFPKTRCAVTTRSARYTGNLAFGPELEIVKVEPLNETQVAKLCENWSRRRVHDKETQLALISAVSGLSEQVAGGGEDGALAENPLMLTAICMIYERHKSLPDDRGRLCDLLIDDLCKSRTSFDEEHKWRLDDGGKKNLLQRIALAMQEQGEQSWPVDQAIEIILNTLSYSETQRHHQARKYLDWTADHTGLLRFIQEEDGTEKIRFWHRLFREYLAANQIAQRDMPTSEITRELWGQKRLHDPFWEDVVRLLPRTLGTQEKAKSLYDTLCSLATDSSEHKGRLFGLAMAGIIENRDLFPAIQYAEKAKELSGVYESEGLQWPLRDRLLFLEGLGRLDPRGFDPRLHKEQWITITAGPAELLLPDESTRQVQVPEFVVGWAPVTVQEYLEFATAKDSADPTFWSDSEKEDDYDYINAIVTQVRTQVQHPNWPVCYVTLKQAEAFCKWQSAHRVDGRIVRLMTGAEWFRIIHSASGYLPPNDEEWPTGQDSIFNWRGAKILHPSPVGTFPAHPSGVVDILGNVFEWVLMSPHYNYRYTSLGGSYDAPESYFYGKILPLTQRVLSKRGLNIVGFRCVLENPS